MKFITTNSPRNVPHDRAACRREREIVGLLHRYLDTVPLGTTAWTKDAFAGETAGDKLFGRGSSDMKSGVAAIMLMALRPARFPARQAGLTIIFTAGMAHKIDEFCHVSKIDFAAEAYTEIAKKW